MNAIKSHTTSREFALANNVSPLRMKNLVNTDNSIKPAFYRNRMYYYEPEKISSWFEKNQHKFNVEVKNINVKSIEFYCGTNDHYVPASEKGASGRRCKSCDAKAAKANEAKSKSMEHTGRGKVPAHILKFETRKSNMAFKIEDKAINDINSWMND
jgi:hypothetical protein